MTEKVARHYAGGVDIVPAIEQGLEALGRTIGSVTTLDLAAVDEFHIRGRKATLELGERMRLDAGSHVLDIGSGLGGPARTLAERYGCRVTGIDLTEAFCRTAEALSGWVGLGERVSFRQGDATAMPFEDGSFDAAMTIHVAMNIPAKDALYAEAKRVLKPGGLFAVYDVLQGEGGEVIFPVPWAREPSISHLATPEEMEALLTAAGFSILDREDSTEESLAWFEKRLAALRKSGQPPLSLQLFLGDDLPQMTANQVKNLRERRIRTVSYICRA